MKDYGLVFEVEHHDGDDDSRSLLGIRLERELDKRAVTGVVTTISDVAVGARFDVKADGFLAAIAVGFATFTEACRTIGIDPVKIVFAEFNRLTEGD
jgi:hypothetical protein